MSQSPVLKMFSAALDPVNCGPLAALNQLVEEIFGTPHETAKDFMKPEQTTTSSGFLWDYFSGNNSALLVQNDPYGVRIHTANRGSDGALYGGSHSFEAMAGFNDKGVFELISVRRSSGGGYKIFKGDEADDKTLLSQLATFIGEHAPELAQKARAAVTAQFPAP